MAKRLLGFAGILMLTLYGITAAGATPALAARQRTARTTTTTTADTPASTTTTAPRPQRTTTTTAPTAPLSVTHAALTPVTPALDGSGTMDAAPSAASAASLHNTLDFTYEAAESMSNGAVTLTVPSNWSSPSLSGTQAGYTTIVPAIPAGAALTISSRTITVSGLNLNSGDIFTINYGDTSLGGPGATAPTSPVLQTWTTKEKSTAGGVLTNLATQPQVTVTAKDGAGTLTTTTTNVGAGSTGNTVTFTYTAPSGGLRGGQVVILAPTGWSAPSVTPGDPGYSTATTGLVSLLGQGVVVSDVTLAVTQTLTITYGDKTGGGPGATAPSTTGPQTWQAMERSSPGPGGNLTNLAASPSINVVSGSTMVVSPDAVSAASINNTMTFTYTAPTGGLNGTVTLTVPTGWSTPSLTGTAAGYTTVSTGTLTISSRTITVSGLTLGGGATLTITYGDRNAVPTHGPGATAPNTPIVQTWPASETSNGSSALVPIGTSPTVTVTAADGKGTMTTTTKNVSAGSTGNTIVFTFTAPAGGVTHGEVAVAAPTGWSAPSLTSTDPGHFTASAGTTFPDVQDMKVIDFTLPAGHTLTITYGDKTGGGPGATAPSTPASLQKWQARERSSLAISGALKNLSTSPTITVNGADGAGTMAITTPVADPDPSSSHQAAVRSGSSGNTIVFTFKAPVGGMVNGAVTLTVPADWPGPSTSTADPGFTKSSLNNTTSPLSVSGQTITVSHVTLSAGSSFTISYGVKTTGGGQGVTAPMIPGPEPWQAQERSTLTGTLVNLGTSPSTLIPTHNIEQNGSHGCNGTLGGGSGTFCFMPNSFNTTTSGTVTFANFTNATHDVDRCTPDVCNGVGPGTGGDANFGGSPDLHPGYQYSVTFNGTGAAAGTYNYRCSIHGYAVMHGTITVS